LTINTAAGIDKFSRQYGDKSKNIRFTSFYIDWEMVCGEYDGIIISPFCWERRLEVMWYYTWDCASGCVWNLSAVIGVTILGASNAEKGEEMADPRYCEGA
jgi:hypothetical protein